jgi:hypothetical protein
VIRSLRLREAAPHAQLQRILLIRLLAVVYDAYYSLDFIVHDAVCGMFGYVTVDSLEAQIQDP